LGAVTEREAIVRTEMRFTLLDFWYLGGGGEGSNNEQHFRRDVRIVRTPETKEGV
jgi:hypothetical protein